MSAPYWATSVMLGTASLLLFVGFFALAIVAEGVFYNLYSQINKYGAYYGLLAVQMGALTVMTIFAPAFVDNFTPKKSLKYAGACFLAFFLGFLFFVGFLNFDYFFYYISQIIVGVGCAVFHVAEGAFIAEQSTPETIDRFTAIKTAISYAGQVLFGAVILAMHDIYVSSPWESIKMAFLGFAIVVGIGLALIHYLPSEAVENSLATTVNPEQSQTRPNLTQSLFHCLGKTNMLLLIPLSIYQGLFTSFFLFVIPSSFNFISQIDLWGSKRDIININIDTLWKYCTCIGGGVIFGGVIMTVGAAYKNRFITKSAMWFHSILMIPALFIIYGCTPEWAFIQPSAESDIPSMLFVTTVAVCAGMCDFFISTYRSILCQKMLPEHRLESFAITGFAQTLSSCVTLVLKPKLDVMSWCILLLALLMIALLADIFIRRHFEVKKEASQHEEDRAKKQQLRVNRKGFVEVIIIS